MPVQFSVARILIGLAILFATVSSQLALAESKASDFIEFYEVGDEDCEEKGGLRVFVKNVHKTQIIDLQLDRYFFDVRQAGRSMFPMKPETSQALGCSRVFDAQQRWELVAAEFISEASVKERYGDYP